MTDAAEREANKERDHQEAVRADLATHVVGLEWLLSQAQDQAFLIDNAIPLREITLITAPPGEAKSWLGYDLMLAISRCRPWMGRDSHTELGASSLLLNYDCPTHEVGRRFKLLGADTDRDDFHFHTARNEGNSDLLKVPEYVENLKRIVDGLRPELIVIDSLRQYHTGNENDSQEIAAIMGTVRALMKWDSTVVILHHSSKSASGARGSGEILAAAGAHIEVHAAPDDGNRWVEWTKSRGWAMKDADKQVAFQLVGDSESGSVRIEVA